MGKFSVDVTTKSIADVNLANKQAYGEGGAAESDWQSSGERLGYPASYPVAPAEGLGPINSVAELQRANARAYGPASSFESPTNMVGDAKHAEDCASRDGKACDCSLSKDADLSSAEEPTGGMDGK